MFLLLSANSSYSRNARFLKGLFDTGGLPEPEAGSDFLRTSLPATLGKQSICDFIAFEYGRQFFGLAFFLQSGVNSHVHRLCMVFALTKEEPLVLVIYRRNIDFSVSLCIVPPVRADA